MKRNGAKQRRARFGASRKSLKQRPNPRYSYVVMVLVNLPPMLAGTLHLGEGLAEPELHCKRTALGLVLNIRWKHQAAAPATEKPCSPATPARRLNSRQRQSKRRLEEFLEKKKILNSKASEVVVRLIDEQLNANPAGGIRRRHRHLSGTPGTVWWVKLMNECPPLRINRRIEDKPQRLKWWATAKRPPFRQPEMTPDPKLKLTCPNFHSRLRRRQIRCKTCRAAMRAVHRPLTSGAVCGDASSFAHHPLLRSLRTGCAGQRSLVLFLLDFSFFGPLLSDWSTSSF